ncbi:hypothetical protein X975_03046, partial [Stegodyphus mimosarum]
MPRSARFFKTLAIFLQSSIPECNRPSCCSWQYFIIVIIFLGYVSVSSAKLTFTLTHLLMKSGIGNRSPLHCIGNINLKSQSPQVAHASLMPGFKRPSL